MLSIKPLDPEAGLGFKANILTLISLILGTLDGSPFGT